MKGTRARIELESSPMAFLSHPARLPGRGAAVAVIAEVAVAELDKMRRFADGHPERWPSHMTKRVEIASASVARMIEATSGAHGAAVRNFEPMSMLHAVTDPSSQWRVWRFE